LLCSFYPLAPTWQARFIAEITDKRLSHQTKASYGNAIKRFEAFFRAREEFYYFDANRQLIVDRIDIEDIQCYLGRRALGFNDGELAAPFNRAKDKKRVGMNAIQGDRAAIMNMFHDRGRTLLQEESESLSRFLAGLAREVAQSLSNGSTARVSKTVGKDNLPFSLYSWIADRYLFSSEPCELWAHAYSIWLWNLMSRNSNTSSFLVSNLHVVDDAVGTFFEYTKTDQGGEKLKSLIHVYANPNSFAICPYLALAIHWIIFDIGIGSVTGPDKDRLSVFDGGTEGNRFYKDLQKLFKTAEGVSQLRAVSMNPEDIGTHSYRKGSSTFAASGTTSAPAIMSICNRAGWSLGDILHRYLKLENGADRYLGRVLCGLDPNECSFDVLPPHFKPLSPEEDTFVQSTIYRVFSRIINSIKFYPQVGPFVNLTPRPNGELLTARIQPVLRLLLASLVYHSSTLIARKRQGSMLDRLDILNDTELLDRLRPLVTLNGGVMKPTGIPPHIQQLRKMEESLILAQRTHGKVHDLSVVVEGLPERTARIIENRAAQKAGVLTPEEIRNNVTALLNHFRERISGLSISELVSPSLSPISPSPSPVSPSPSPNSPASNSMTVEVPLSNPGFPIHFWGGRFHRAPETFRLTPESLRSSWCKWWFGSTVGSDQLPPYRRFESGDLHSSNSNFFSRYRIVMKRLEQQLEKQQWNLRSRPITRQNEQEAWRSLNLFVLAVSQFNSRSAMPVGLDSIHLTTVAKKLGKLGKDWVFDPAQPPDQPSEFVPVPPPPLSSAAVRIERNQLQVENADSLQHVSVEPSPGIRLSHPPSTSPSGPLTTEHSQHSLSTPPLGLPPETPVAEPLSTSVLTPPQLSVSGQRRRARSAIITPAKRYRNSKS